MLKSSTRNKDQGLSLIEIIGCLALIAFIAAGTMYFLSDQNDNNRNMIVAGQLNTVADAANKYMSANYVELLANTASAPVYLSTGGSSIAALKAEGYLNDGFNAVNALGQNYKVIYRQKTPDELEGILVTDGGTNIDRADLGAISRTLGADSAVIDENIAKGALGGWTRDIAPFEAATTIADSNQLAYMLHGDGSNVENNSLYRYSTPGNPDTNKMHTGIDMNNNDVSGAGQLQGDLVVGTNGILPAKIVAEGDPCQIPGLLAGTTNGQPVFCEKTSMKYATLKGEAGTPGGGTGSYPADPTPPHIKTAQKIGSWYNGTYWTAKYQGFQQCKCSSQPLNCTYTTNPNKVVCGKCEFEGNCH